MRKIIIVRAAGNELANQLWNYVSIYAYAVERGFTVKNPSFFEYGEYFNMQSSPNLILRAIFFLPLRNYTKRKTALLRKILRKIYSWYSGLVLKLHEEDVVVSNNLEVKPFYLPPSAQAGGKLTGLENTKNNIYLNGWLFRNPAGIEKYRKEILVYFRPREDILKRAEENISRLRENYETVVGVHIRQGDYKTWRGGAYFIPEKRVREILDEFLKETGKDKSKVCFAVTSDGTIDTSEFSGLNVFVSKENAVHDLFLLSQTDAVIGSNSTFGAFASYFGDIPLIVMQKDRMDWEYYRGKTKFFENKFSTFVYY